MGLAIEDKRVWGVWRDNEPAQPEGVYVNHWSRSRQAAWRRSIATVFAVPEDLCIGRKNGHNVVQDEIVPIIARAGNENEPISIVALELTVGRRRLATAEVGQPDEGADSGENESDDNLAYQLTDLLHLGVLTASAPGAC